MSCSRPSSVKSHCSAIRPTAYRGGTTRKYRAGTAESIGVTQSQVPVVMVLVPTGTQLVRLVVASITAPAPAGPVTCNCNSVADNACTDEIETRDGAGVPPKASSIVTVRLVTDAGAALVRL